MMSDISGIFRINDGTNWRNGRLCMMPKSWLLKCDHVTASKGSAVTSNDH